MVRIHPPQPIIIVKYSISITAITIASGAKNTCSIQVWSANQNKNMHIKHSTKVPVQLSDKLIKKVLKNHNQIIQESSNTIRENTNDAEWAVTKSSTIPKW